MSKNSLTPERLFPEVGSGWVPVSIGESPAAVFYDPVGRRHLKMVAAEHLADLVAERDRTIWLSKRGFPTASVLDWDESATGAYLITSTVPGVSADQLDADALLLAWPSIIDTVRRLHDLPTDQCPFRAGLSNLMARAREIVAADRVHTEFLPPQLRDTPAVTILADIESELSNRIAVEEATLVVCHGDLCLPNILIHPVTHHVSGLIDVGRLGRADPHVDIAVLLSNARGTWSDEASARRADRAFAQGYGHPLDEDRLQFYGKLDPLTW